MERLDYLTGQFLELFEMIGNMADAISILQIHEGMTDGETAEMLNEIF